MEKILTQEEISALVKGIEDGKVEVSGEKNAGGAAVPYDFFARSPGFQDDWPAMKPANENFCRSLRQGLASVLRKTIQVSLPQAQTMRYGDFIGTQPAPASLHLFRMDPLRGQALLAMEPKLIFSFIDILLGGNGKGAPPPEGREFTAVEERLIQKIAVQILKALEKAWAPLHPFSLHYLRAEKNPDAAAAAEEADWALLLSFSLEMEQPLGAFVFCLPWALLEPLREKLSGVKKKEAVQADPKWAERLAGRLGNSEVEVVVEFGRGRVKAETLLGLKAGDVLPLNKDPGEPLQARIQGVPKFLGRGGVYGANRAFQVEAKIAGS